MSLESDLEKVLKIKTTGRDDTNSDLTNYPYEATSYEILRELTYSGHITKLDKLIDFGCGKGRVDFHLSYFTKAKMIGIEYDIRLYNRAIDNHKTSVCSNRVEFINCCASTYSIGIDVTGAYFFNPFSIHILKKVLENIKISLNNYNREFKLFFYYPSDEYLNLLDHDSQIEHIEDIECMNLFKHDDKRERIAIYKMKEEM